MYEKLSPRDRRALAASEGYLTLGLPEHALRELEQVSQPHVAAFEYHVLKGGVLRELQRHFEALEAFDVAFVANPDDVSLLLAMAWCYKRTQQLPKAITAMEMAHRVAPREAVILYNLSCYWSLSGNKNQALSWLGRALRLDRSLRGLIDEESDFDPLRDDPDFRRLLRMVDADPA